MATAYLITSPSNWQSGNAAFTTIGNTGDQQRGGCWNTGPNFNTWFKFQATTPFAEIQMLTGGAQGNLRYPYIALRDAAGNELACAKYSSSYSDLSVSTGSLVPGNWYYVTVDNYNHSNYCGTFTLSINDQASYDLKAGALPVGTSNWNSGNAAYTTMGALGDESRPSCWNTGPNFNRWFKFQATSSFVDVQLLTGGSQGSLRYPYVALWDSAGNVLACAKYASSTSDLQIGATGLNPGNTYYISVDNYNSSSYRGTFSLSVHDQPSYDFKAGAISVGTNNWSSGNAAYSTMGALGDEARPSCWNTGPNFNRWFKFVATSSFVDVQLLTGGSQGSLRYPYVALWDSAGNVIACAKYANSTSDLQIGATGLNPGDTYYISVDNYNSSSYRGTFSLYVHDQPSYDFKAGAITVGTMAWTSGNAAYSTMGALGDQPRPSCWNTGPNFNRWFKFQATFDSLHLELRTGGAEGSLRYPYLALWDTLGNEIDCAKYTSSTSDLSIHRNDLVPGNWYYISADNYNSPSYRGSFTLNIDNLPSQNSSLPVELIGFEAKWKQGAAEITWLTAAERNTDHFVVERSADASNFVEIGAVKAVGNSNQLRHYALVDDAPLEGTNWYRLRIVDEDGDFMHTEKVELFPGEAEGTSVAVYPNPVGDEIIHIVVSNIENAERVDLSMSDGSGKTIFRESADASHGDYQRDFDPSNLPKGVYYLCLSAGQRKWFRRIVKL